MALESPLPFIGNGDLHTPVLVKARYINTNCHALMIARGALRNPFIFLESLAEPEDGIKFDGSLTANNYYDKSIIKLDYNFISNSGNKISYTNLMIKLLQNSLEQVSYKQSNYENNIYLETENKDVNRKKTIQDYEKLAESITSTACENSLFINSINDRMVVKDSDLLTLCFYYDNILNLEVNDFWKEDFSLLSVYSVDVRSRYKMVGAYCRSRIYNDNDISAFNDWFKKMGNK
jgi:hypothetical protein